MAVDADVVIGVDPHKASNTAAVMDPLTKVVLASERFANTAAGYRQLREFSGRWQQRRWAVEGCHGAGRSLAQRLVGDGELVLDVPAKLAARVRVYSQGHGRKTDVDDAVSIGLAAVNSNGVAAVRADDTLVSLRLLSDRRDELGALRTQAVCRLHRLLAELTPGGTHRRLKASRAQHLLDMLRPEDPVAKVRLQLAEQHLDDIKALDAKLKTVREQINALVETTGSRLVDLYGIGPIIAGRILAEVETVDRFPSKDHFASYNGTAPIDASSGDQVRHRLSRAGNRRLNHALHMMAVTQIRQPNSPGRGYYERKRLEGQNPEGSAALLEATTVRRRLLAARGRPARHNRAVRITYDRDANTAYIHLGRHAAAAHRATTQAKPGGHGPGAVRTRPDGRGTPGLVFNDWPGDHGEVLRGSRGDAAGTESGSSFIERITVNTGTVPVLPAAAHPARCSGWARRPLTGPGWGGAAVVLRAGESPSTWGRAAAVSSRD